MFVFRWTEFRMSFNLELSSFSVFLASCPGSAPIHRAILTLPNSAPGGVNGPPKYLRISNPCPHEDKNSSRNYWIRIRNDDYVWRSYLKWAGRMCGGYDDRGAASRWWRARLIPETIPLPSSCPTAFPSSPWEAFKAYTQMPSKKTRFWAHSFNTGWKRRWIALKKTRASSTGYKTDELPIQPSWSCDHATPVGTKKASPSPRRAWRARKRPPSPLPWHTILKTWLPLSHPPRTTRASVIFCRLCWLFFYWNET